MKRLSLIITLLCVCICANSQTIKENSMWFDGNALYTAFYEDGKVHFSGYSEYDFNLNFTLRPDASVTGLYYLEPENENDRYPKFRAQFGDRAWYTRREGMTFIALYNANDEIVWTFVLTPDDLSSCLSGQQWAKEQDFSEMASSYLMNPAFLSTESIGQLRLQMENFNANPPKSVIEKVNSDLIKNELRLEPEERKVGAVFVTSAAEFVSAIRPYSTIVVEEEVEINLTEILESADFFNTKGRHKSLALDPDSIRPEPCVISEYTTDGSQLTICNIDHLNIIGKKNSSIVVEPRYAYVLNFINCRNINIRNITLGHTEQGHCDAGVLGLTNCSDVFVNESDLYGCGAYGIVADNVKGMNVEYSIIRDCSYGIMILKSSSKVGFAACDFYNNEQYTLVEVDPRCQDVGFFGCRFFGNRGRLFDIQTSTLFYDCVIYHSSESEMGIDKTYMTFSGSNNIKATSQMLNVAAGPDRNFSDVGGNSEIPVVAKVAMCKSRSEGLAMVASDKLPDPFIYGAWDEGEQTFVVIPQKEGVHLELWSAKLDETSYDVVLDGTAPLAKARKGQPLCFSYILPDGMPTLMVIAVDESGYQSAWVPQISGEDGSLLTDSEFVAY